MTIRTITKDNPLTSVTPVAIPAPTPAPIVPIVAAAIPEEVSTTEEAVYSKPTPQAALSDICFQILVKIKAIREAVHERALGKAEHYLEDIETETTFLLHNLKEQSLREPSILEEAMRKFKLTGVYSPEFERLIGKIENRRKFNSLFGDK